MKPSEPLVRLLRESVDRRGLNTASLATTLGMPRSELKHMLAGTEPLTVDLMIALAEILEPLPAPQPKSEALVVSSDPTEKPEPQRMQVMAAPSKPEPSEVKKAPAKEASDKPRVLEIEELKKLMAVIAPSGVKIRSGPGQEHWVVGTKFKGATLAATGKVKGKDWIRVSLPTGIQGYVFAPLLADVGANATQGTQP